MFPTTTAGSLPKPGWLSETEKIWPEWRLSGEALEQGKRDAALVLIKEQEAAGIDIVSDGEMSKISYVNYLKHRLDGFGAPAPLGWAAQDMLDRVLDGDLAPCDNLQELVAEVVAGLPQLVNSYKTPGMMDATVARELTNRCFKAAKSGGDDLAEDMPAAEARTSNQPNLAEQQPLA